MPVKMNAGVCHLLEAPVFCKRWKDPEERRCLVGGKGSNAACVEWSVVPGPSRS